MQENEKDDGETCSEEDMQLGCFDQGKHCYPEDFVLQLPYFRRGFSGLQQGLGGVFYLNGSSPIGVSTGLANGDGFRGVNGVMCYGGENTFGIGYQTL